MMRKDWIYGWENGIWNACWQLKIAIELKWVILWIKFYVRAVIYISNDSEYIHHKIISIHKNSKAQSKSSQVTKAFETSNNVVIVCSKIFRRTLAKSN